MAAGFVIFVGAFFQRAGIRAGTIVKSSLIGAKIRYAEPFIAEGTFEPGAVRA